MPITVTRILDNTQLSQTLYARLERFDCRVRVFVLDTTSFNVFLFANAYEFLSSNCVFSREHFDNQLSRH